MTEFNKFFKTLWGVELTDFPLWEKIDLAKLKSAYYYQKDIVGLIKQLKHLEEKWGDKL